MHALAILFATTLATWVQASEIDQAYQNYSVQAAQLENSIDDLKTLLASTSKKDRAFDLTEDLAALSAGQVALVGRAEWLLIQKNGGTTAVPLFAMQAALYLDYLQFLLDTLTDLPNSDRSTLQQIRRELVEYIDDAVALDQKIELDLGDAIADAEQSSDDILEILGLIEARNSIVNPQVPRALSESVTRLDETLAAIDDLIFAQVAEVEDLASRLEAILAPLNDLFPT